jgi:hypothetical protein
MPSLHVVVCPEVDFICVGESRGVDPVLPSLVEWCGGWYLQAIVVLEPRGDGLCCLSGSRQRVPTVYDMVRAGGVRRLI